MSDIAAEQPKSGSFSTVGVSHALVKVSVALVTSLLQPQPSFIAAMGKQCMLETFVRKYCMHGRLDAFAALFACITRTIVTC